MQRQLLILVFLLFSFLLFAQTPDWQWATQAGGNSYDQGSGIAIDDNGSSYVTGTFRSTATFGSYSLTSSGSSDIFVAKMDANGNWLWATQAGGISSNYGYAIAIDDNGNSYVTGLFGGTITFGSYSLTSSGNWDIFIAKIDSNGNWLWATKAGGVSNDGGYVITIDDNGNSYVTGWFYSYLATFGPYSLTSSGSSDIFVAKMDANGNWLWAKQAGGISCDYGYGITTDDNGNSYVTGCFADTATFGSYSLTSSGSSDIFVAKMDANGNWQWATNAGGINYDTGDGIAIEDNGNSYVTGLFGGTITFGSYSLTGSGSFDIFVAKLGNDTSVENEIIPTKMKLSNFPNPFNPSTTISFTIASATQEVLVEVYNIKGQKIKTLVNDEFDAGSHSIIWNGDDEYGKSVSSGIYYYKLNVNGKTEVVKKCLLLK